MLIFGTRGVTTTRSRGDFHCPQCGDTRNYLQKGVRKFVTLYFIPLFPMKTMGEYVECQACRGTYHPDVLNYDPQAAREQMRTHFCETLKQVMVQVLLADERVHDAEIETVRNLFRKVSGQELGEDELRAEIRSAEASPDRTLEELNRMAAMLGDDSKETIIKAALLVASSDGEIDANERELIQHVAGAIQMSPAHMRGVLAEMHDERETDPAHARQHGMMN